MFPYSPFANSSPAHAAAVHSSNSSQYVDAVIALDNVSQIAVHDPGSDRFSAAQLFVDLAPSGDQIGTIKISGSHNPTQVSGYHGLTNMDAQGKNDLKHTLSQQVFGPVEGLGNPNYPAYIAPALQAAGNMLVKAPPENRRYVIIVTDAVALSGDQNNNCSAPTYHKWFCEVDNLEHENISVVLIGFVKPGSEDALKPTQQYIQTHGGMVFPVSDGAGLSHRLALAYTDLLTRIHPSMFYADLGGVPSSLNIDQHALLTSTTFVALGNPGVSLSSLLPPGSNDSVAGKSTGDGLYYSSPPGSGYWLETDSKGSLGGMWRLTPGGTAPGDIMVIAISEAHFDLMNPASANAESDVSVRYIAQRGPVVLHAQVTDTGGQPLTNVPLIVNPLSNPAPFASNTLPGYDASDVEALLSKGGTQQIQVGLGNALIPGVYFTKRFQLQAQSGLGTTQITVPVPTLLPQGSSIHISAQGPSGSLTALYGRDPSSDWKAFGDSGSPNVSGDFTLTRGCGITYTFEAVSEVIGDFPMGHYDYVTYAQQTYSSQLQQVITGNAGLPSSTYIEWWNSQPKWTVTFTSSTCSAQNAGLGVKLNSTNFTTPAISIANSPQYSLANGSAIFPIAKNMQTQVQVLANVGGCGFALNDRTASFELLPTIQPLQGGPIVEQGTWQTTVTCPSVLTNAKRYWPVSAFSVFLLTVFTSRLWQWVLARFRKVHLDGKIEYATEFSESDLEGEGEELETLDPLRVAVSIPRLPRLPIWYLDRHTDGEQVIYSFEPRESALSLLKFSVKSEAGGKTVKVEATKNAHGDKIPIFRIMRLPIGQEPCTCDGEPIEIGQDVIYPDIHVGI